MYIYIYIYIYLYIYIVYEVVYISTCPTLENCLLGAVSLTKNADIAKYEYSG